MVNNLEESVYRLEVTSSGTWVKDDLIREMVAVDVNRINITSIVSIDPLMGQIR